MERRNELAERYRHLLADVAVGLPPAGRPGHRHAYHLFPVLVDNRGVVYDRMREKVLGEGKPLSMLQLGLMAENQYGAASVVGVFLLLLTVGVAIVARAFGLRFGAGGTAR